MLREPLIIVTKSDTGVSKVYRTKFYFCRPMQYLRILFLLILQTFLLETEVHSTTNWKTEYIFRQ